MNISRWCCLIYSVNSMRDTECYKCVQRPAYIINEGLYIYIFIYIFLSFSLYIYKYCWRNKLSNTTAKCLYMVRVCLYMVCTCLYIVIYIIYTCFNMVLCWYMKLIIDLYMIIDIRILPIYSYKCCLINSVNRIYSPNSACTMGSLRLF